MSIKEIIDYGGTLVFDPLETTLTPDDFLIKYGEIVNGICLVAKSEYGTTYYPSGTAPADERFSQTFAAFAQIATDLGITTYAMIHGNKDSFFSRDPNFQMKKSGGKQIEQYVCPNQNGYWQYIGEIAAEIAKHTEVSGIIIKDFLYPRETSCFCDHCRRTFASDTNYHSRDFTLDNLKQDGKINDWNTKRLETIRDFSKTVVNRIHREKKLDVMTEILLDPKTDFFTGAATHFGQDLNYLSQAVSHVLLHIYPWSDFPVTEKDLNVFYDEIKPKLSKLAEMENSLYVWGLDIEKFAIARQIQDTLGSRNIFFTEGNPPSYPDRRSLHLELGV